MKKISLTSLLVIVLLLMLASTASAVNPHGSYTANTDACASCHVTHAAIGAKLLTASDQTAFCESCHGGSGSVLDVVKGYNTTAAQSTTGGGFEAVDPGNPSIVITTSKHMLNATSIPGGGSMPTGGLQCGSCHDPHGSSNARLLKTKVNGSAVDIPIKMHKNTSNQVIEYLNGSSNWCGACHSRFNKAQGSGHDNTGDAMNLFRHAMNVNATLPAGAVDALPYLAGTPLETNNVYDATDTTIVTPGANKTLGCITCHRAHGTTTTVSGYAASYRQESGSTASGSALLRMNNRGVCLNCHGAATSNLPQ